MLDAARRNGEFFVLSVITELELFAHPILKDEDVIHIEGLLHTVRVVPLDSTLARRAASLRRNTCLKLCDSIIAATAILLDAPIMTCDKAFQKIDELQTIVPQCLISKSHPTQTTS